MSPVLWWRLGLVLALAAAAGYMLHLIRENALQTAAIESLTEAVTTLTERARRVDLAIAANDAADSETRAQANRAIGKIQTFRRTDSEVIAIDKPWPAAMRGRVFDNPDPASGSTEPADATGAGVRGGPVQESR